MKNVLITSALCILFACFAGAQTYTQITEGGWGVSRDFTRPCFADLDHDGLLDLIRGEHGGTLEHLEQDAPGSSIFITITNTFNDIMMEGYPAPRIVDLDHDGLLDLIIGNSYGTLRHYKQNADGDTAFSLVSELFNGIDVGGISTPSFTDLDNDGLWDMIVGEEDGYLSHYVQDNANSTAMTLVTEKFNDIDIGLISTPCFFDLDDDGLLDLIVGENKGFLHHFEQSGVGSTVFDSVTSNFCSLIVGQPCPVFVDLDNNDLIDLMIGVNRGQVMHFEQESTSSDSVIMISGNILPGKDFGDQTAPSLTDLDNDGLLDMIIGIGDGTLTHLEQDAAGSSFFSVVTDMFNDIKVVGGHAQPTFIDLDQDGLLDLVIGSSQGLLKHFKQISENSTSFAEGEDTFDGIDVGRCSAPSFTDLDQDGLLDLIIGNNDGMLFHYKQDSIGSLDFVLVSDFFNEIDLPYLANPCFTDIDGDGLLDMIVGEEDGNLNHYEQNAEGSTGFSLITSTFADIDVGKNSKPHFGDINGDGLDDLLIGERYGGIYYYQRDKETNIPEHDIINKSVQHFKLMPNFPNPFNPVTSIKYELPATEHVIIKLYNVLGREVATLVDKIQEAGYYTIEWDGSEYASGIVVLWINAGPYHKNMKMVLLK